MAILRLLANQICFSRQICKTGCPQCYLEVIRFVCPDINITLLVAVVMMYSRCQLLCSYAGTAAYQHGSVRIWSTIFPSKQSSCEAAVKVPANNLFQRLSMDCCSSCRPPKRSATKSMDSAQHFGHSGFDVSLTC